MADLDVGDVAFSRAAVGEKQVELRGPCPVSTVNVLDAISMARGQTRTELVNEILGRWARQIQHESTLVQNVSRVTPELAEAGGRA